MPRHYAQRPEPDPAPVAIAEPEQPLDLGPGVRESHCQKHGTRFLQFAHPEWGWDYASGQCPDCSVEARLAPLASEELKAQQIEIAKRIQERLAARADEIEQSVEAILEEEVPARRAELTEWYRSEFGTEERMTVESEMHSEILARLVAEAKAQEKGN